MFVHHCTACAKRQLIFPSQIRTVSAGPDGFLMGFICWCGAGQVHEVADRAAVAA